MTEASPKIRDGTTAIVLLALTAVIYGGRLDVAYLSDDFLYLSWWQEGWGELLRRVTIDSSPRMIRPLPALVWAFSALPGGALLHHGLSLLFHAICGALVARLVVRTGGSPEAGLWSAALFVCFPLFTEPVLWLSAAPDLWACAAALGALHIGLGPGPGALWGAAGLFALSLLSKESTLALPAIALCVAPWHRARPLALTLATIASLYLTCRLLLFSGIGGYLDEAGRSSALAVDPIRFLRNVALQLPYRILSPLKRAGDLAPWLALLTVGLTMATVFAARLWRRPGPLLRGAAALILALIPVMAYFAIDLDHENARLLYFPLASLAAAAGGALGTLPSRGPAKRTRVLLGTWVVFWSLVTIANGRPWSEGALEIRRTLTAMREAQDRYPTDATVLITGHDTWRGAYVWRNGLAFAARRTGLRDDLHWTLGSVALVPRPEPLGHRIFGLGIDTGGRTRDWTGCQRQLLTAPLDVLGRAVPTSVAPAHFETGPIPLSRSSRFLALKIVTSGSPPPSGLAGRALWREPRPSRFGIFGLGAPRFNATEAESFRIFGGRNDGEPPHSIVRLPTAPRPQPSLDVRVELADRAPPTQLSEILVVEAPEPCR